jgi:hypothetical protein
MPKLDGEALRRKREKLEAELETLRFLEREGEDRKNAIAGRIVLAHAQKDTAFAETLSRLFDGALRKSRERALFDLPVAAKGTRASRASDATAAGPAAAAAEGGALPTPTDQSLT